MANQLARHLRKVSTPAERHLWRELRALRPLGYHFRRQVPFGQYVVDFACLSRRLVIEVDGSQHFEPRGAASDAIRDDYIRWRGFTVLRFGNADVLRNPSGVMESALIELGGIQGRG
jgi:very-short-patch-repair endonuclease